MSIEKVIDLAPDLVLATSLTEARAVKRLRRLGVAVIVFREPRSFDEMNRQFLDLGKITGEEERALAIVRRAEAKTARIMARVRGLAKPRVFVQIGTKPLFTAAGGTLVNGMVEYAGGTNIAAGAKTGFYNREEVVSRDPDVIFIVGMGIAPENERAVWQKFYTMSAVRHNRIFILDPYKTCSPTPETFVETLAAIAAAVHPGLE